MAHSPSLKSILKVLAVVCVFAAAGLGLVFLEKYVKQAVPVPEEIGTLKLVNPPLWVNQALKDKIYAAAGANGEDLKLDENTARLVQQNIEARVAWLETCVGPAGTSAGLVRSQRSTLAGLLSPGVQTKGQTITT